MHLKQEFSHQVDVLLTARQNYVEFSSHRC